MFITTTVQSPSWTAQVSVRVPVPWARAAQGSAAAGAAGTPVPGWSVTSCPSTVV